MKCPKCGSELRKGLSFCPKCGEVVNTNDKKQVKVETTAKKKTPAWLMVLAVLFFPISLTYLLIKSKMKMPIKIILICALWIFVIAVGGSEESQDTSNISDTQSEYSDTSTTTQDIVSEDTEEESEEQKEEVKYHTDEGVNQLFVTYNEIAETPISPDMINDGAYSDCANTIINGIWIQVTDNDRALFVDYSEESASAEHIYPVFRDFTKAMNSALTDDEIKNAWEELKTGEYDNYYSNRYDLGGIKIMYSIQELNNGEFRFIIKTQLDK